MAARSRALSAFKELHRTVQYVFAGDRKALTAGRLKINSEFQKFKSEANPKKIEDHIQLANDTVRLLRLTVVQGKMMDDGKTYEMRFRKETHFEDNVMFDPNADIPAKPRRPKKSPRSVESVNIDIGKMSGKHNGKR